MKLVLTHTYFLEEDAHEKRVMKPYPPLGLLYLSAYLKQHQVDVQVYDTTFSSFPELIAYLEAEKPDVLGIHCNLLTKFTVLKLIRYCRSKGIIALLGGPDASTQVQEFLDYGADIIISGEGEEPLLAVLKALGKGDKHHLQGIPNVSFRDEGGAIVQNPRQASRRHLDEYPFPDREAIDLHRYLDTWERHHGVRSVSLITARGCAFTCKWCSHSVYGHTHRRRRPEKVVEEIQMLRERYRPTHLWFADDVFTVNKRWLLHFHQLMSEAGIRLPFECIARADRLDEELVEVLKDLGCYRIWFGAESGSQRILDAMSRGVTREQIADATRWCRKHGIQAGYFVMFGYPGEELPDIYQTIEFVRDQQPDVYLTTVAYPLRGTALYEEIKDRILYPNGWTSHLQRELDIQGRFPRRLYDYAARKLASEYRRMELRHTRRHPLRQMLHALRSAYCDLRMKQLSHRRTENPR
ncbi:MAG: radical SAM protein [Calditrichaeota bacterium]|nr:MAG: radical SAM protein [Calditrichota bacterium]